MKNVMLILGLLILTLALSACNYKPHELSDFTEPDTMKKEEKRVESLSLIDENGKTFTLESLKGKPVYIKFWASWCSICLAGLDEVNILSGEMNDFHVLTVVSPDYNGEQSMDAFKTWFSGLEHKNMKVLFDLDGNVSKQFGVKGYPTSIFIDAEGHLIKTQPGHMDNDSIKKVFNEIGM